jgi:hypothetical protein
MSARIFNVLLGTWLFLSAFAWPHMPATKVATMVGGALTVVTALFSIYHPRVRYLTAVFAVLLFVGTLATLSARNQTFWHNAVCAIAIFIAAMFDRGTVGARSRRDERDELSDQLRRPIGPAPRSPASRA